MRPSAPLLRVRDLSVTHEGAAHPALRDVSFDVHPGEVVLLLGPSGSGKSTLTLTLNGLIPQSVENAAMTGSVQVSGLDTRTTAVAQLSTEVSMVFQDPDSQLVTGTVLDEVAFALENLRMPPSEVLARAEQALRRMGLWGRRRWNPDLLSGGGRQRLAIACALALRSRVIVLDEPTANLDPQGVHDVYSALGELIQDAEERAIVLVEHDVDAAVDLATRVIVLDHDGRVQLDGPARQTLRQHAHALRELGVLASGDRLPATVDRMPGTGAEGRARQMILSPLDTDAAPYPAISDPAITARGLVVDKRGARLLDVPHLDIARGSFTVIMGANGAGKTTLLQTLGGVVPPTHGTVIVDGLDAGRASPRALAAHVGFVFQNPEHQFIAATVRDELAHGLRLQRIGAAEIDERVDDMLARFGLTAKAHMHPFLLSGGEKRRLSVGTALIARPSVIALDEPTFGQDRARAAELLGLLQELQRSGTTVVIVSHDRRLIAEYATDAVLIGDGEVIAVGPAAELLAQTEPDALASGPAVGPAAPVTEPTPIDPYADAPAPARFWLHGINPLAKFGAVIPAMALLAFTRDLLTPAILLAAAYAVILTGARLTRRTAAVLLLGVPLAIAVLSVGFGVWVDAEQVAGTGAVMRIGDWTLHAGALLSGLATALRLAGILTLALIGGLTTRGPDLVRASVQQLRVPYRIGYTALAAYRFVPRFAYELSIIRAAHRVRGQGGGRGPVARIARGWGYIVPLLASGIRHAERVALSMDARAFGAYATRTERHVVPWRTRDTVFMVAVLLASAVVFALTFPWQPT
ncbi:ATP-binding cassette domain-containing protein [Microbacterium sp. nov. GSS16]|uniref:ATP-binding cassette domain-containing protein n=1 Tax=Microbacterium sp. nov. GSS16 TaxID=3019890 RepID=UPI002306B165|nr:ATP-binding cassette domain-containing protein [Microbacterium sp. nov. GSS16]WCD93170.1 ATP-binding cassette domain-containing protein [Microbacterium sp. nov. GSS16]